MGPIKHGMPRPRWATLRVGEIAKAMGVAVITGLGVSLCTDQTGASTKLQMQPEWNNDQEISL